MKNPTITELRKAGFKVSVRHIRRWSYRGPKDVFVMRHEYPDATAQLRDAAAPPDPATRPGWVLQAKGGRTELHLTVPDSTITVVGETVCGKKEVYCNREGRNKALGRALAKLEVEAQLDLTALGVQALIAADVLQEEAACA